MKDENKTYLTTYVNHETKQRFNKIKKSSDFKNDAFINYLLDLYEKENGGKENAK